MFVANPFSKLTVPLIDVAANSPRKQKGHGDAKNADGMSEKHLSKLWRPALQIAPIVRFVGGVR